MLPIINKSAKISAELAKIQGFRKVLKTLEDPRFKEHLLRTKMPKAEVEKYIDKLKSNILRAAKIKASTTNSKNINGQAKPFYDKNKKVLWLLEISENASNPSKTAEHEGWHIATDAGYMVKDGKFVKSNGVFEKTPEQIHNELIAPKFKLGISDELKKELSKQDENATRARVITGDMYEFPGLTYEGLINTYLYNSNKPLLVGSNLTPEMHRLGQSFLAKYGNDLNWRQMIHAYEPNSLNHFFKNFRSLLIPITIIAGGGLLAYNNSEGNYELN